MKNISPILIFFSCLTFLSPYKSTKPLKSPFSYWWISLIFIFEILRQEFSYEKQLFVEKIKIKNPTVDGGVQNGRLESKGTFVVLKITNTLLYLYVIVSNRIIVL